jgi:hypothetical protein
MYFSSQDRARTFAPAANLCYTVVDVRCCGSKRGCCDRFLVSIPLGHLLYSHQKRWSLPGEPACGPVFPFSSPLQPLSGENQRLISKALCSSPQADVRIFRNDTYGHIPFRLCPTGRGVLPAVVIRSRKGGTCRRDNQIRQQTGVPALVENTHPVLAEKCHPCRDQALGPNNPFRYSK